MKRIFIALIMVVILLSGCTEAEKVSYNVSKQADVFNVTRRITVINTRSDQCLMQMTGLMSIEDVTDGIAVLIKLDDNTYQKHYVYLNDWTMYIVEDLSGAEVSPYKYELIFLPESLVPVRIKGED